MIAFFGEQPEVNVIAAYVEGISNGEKFIKIASEVSKEKPIELYRKLVGRVRVPGLFPHIRDRLQVPIPLIRQLSSKRVWLKYLILLLFLMLPGH